MMKIRIPESQVAAFKSFCTAFSRTLESQNGLRLRGNKLFNAIARAAGHDSYTALLIDANTYGKGHLDWSTLPKRLSEHLSQLINVPCSSCLLALNSSIPKNANENIIETPMRSIEHPSCEETTLPTIGELYAGRYRSPVLQTMDSFISRHVGIQAAIAHIPNDPLNFTELSVLSKRVHRLIPQDKGVQETDIAGWIIDNGRRLGIICGRHFTVILSPSLRIENLSVRDIDLAFRRFEVEIESTNLFFHRRAHSTCIGLAHALVERHPNVSSPTLAQTILEVGSLNDVLSLLSSEPLSGNTHELVSNVIKMHALDAVRTRGPFSNRDDYSFRLTCGYIPLVLSSKSYMRNWGSNNFAATTI